MLKRIKRLPPWWLVLFYLLLLGCLFVFAELAEGVYAVAGFGFDGAVLRWLFENRTAWLTRLALLLDVVGISYLLGAVVLTLSVWWWRISRSAAIFVLFGFWGAVGVNLATKAYFERARPDLFEQLTPITNSSFPSGHAMGSLAFWLTITVVVHRLWPHRTLAVGVPLGVFALLVGVSRVYLQVHYPSDVLAGWLLSTAWVVAMTLWYSRGSRHASRRLAEARLSRTAAPTEDPEAAHEDAVARGARE